MKQRRIYRYYLILLIIVTVGAILRFSNLGLKPLWLDEVITATFSLGNNYQKFPLDVILNLNQLSEVFTYQHGVSCPQIAENIASQSTHPPLFFCWLYQWLGWMTPLGEDWVVKLRSLSAVFGIVAIPIMYAINSLAYSRNAGLIAAAIMAVSPFAVYLSQEARHYTLPMMLISLSLWVLLQIQQDIFRKQGVKVWVWIVWVVVHTISFYTHYFCILAFIAEIGTLLLLMLRYQQKIIQKTQIWLGFIISIIGIVIAFFPWLLVTFSHANRAETNWITTSDYFIPLYQTIINWLLMVIVLPLENQPLPVVVISGLLMIGFGIWLGQFLFKGFKYLWYTPKTHLPTITLLSFTAIVLLEFFVIVYVLKKDITSAPRYSFVYYPAICALIGATLSSRITFKFKRKRTTAIILVTSLISSIFVTYNLGLKKPFTPERVAQIINQEPSQPLMVVMAYVGYQDIALGWSFALAVQSLRDNNIEPTHFAFFQQSPNLQTVWQKLSQLSPLQVSQLNLWIIAPARKRQDYPPQVQVSSALNCNIDTNQHYRIGVPYQLYRCNK
ncbi:glycosyltransferase family 39 protein [Calothrix rhizosoleniae]|uniref:glycosyltransferase family 39 protein n=1 Tax=Calothrix rhizosoleniae TaxID=888997 RepID=UPI000B4A2CFD|nr:glycosyltransferase family 39 protein [Calothrix rhizosoleniae]